MKVFCWDFDGTLTRSNSLWGGSMRDILRSLVPNISDELCEKARRGMWGKYPWDIEDVRPLLDDAWWEYVGKQFYESCVNCGISPVTAEKAASLLRPTVKQPARYALYEDAIPTLSQLKERGAKNVLLSNNFPDLEEVMAALGLLPYFDGIVISGKVGYNKPRKEIFELAMRKYPDAEYYMIGDNPTADMLGGKQCGMKTIFVHKGACDQADVCLDDLSALPSKLVWE